MKAPEKIREDPFGSGTANRWNPPDREWLEYQHFVLGKHWGKVAKEFGIGCGTLNSWKKELNVSVWNLISEGDLRPPYKVEGGRKAGNRFYGVTKSWLNYEYWDQEKSSSEIADEADTNRTTVLSWMAKLDVPVRNTEERAERHSERMSGKGNPAWIGGTSQNYQRRNFEANSDEPKCNWCGSTKNIVMHHVNHDRIDGNLGNLMWLCHNCNIIEGYLWLMKEEGYVQNFSMEDNKLIVEYNLEKQN